LIERGELKSSLVDVATVEAVVLQLTRDEEDLHQVYYVYICTHDPMTPSRRRAFGTTSELRTFHMH
jgi:hypothetical protein